MTTETDTDDESHEGDQQSAADTEKFVVPMDEFPEVGEIVQPFHLDEHTYEVLSIDKRRKRPIEVKHLETGNQFWVNRTDLESYRDSVSAKVYQTRDGREAVGGIDE